jgi:leucyl-tRNA synthetase
VPPRDAPTYDPSVIEPRWQRRWQEWRVFESSADPARRKYYCYNPAPYVTGSLHMGHVRNYTCGDLVAKLMRLRGAAVLYTIGFDAFGLPTEMAAIRSATDPEQWTAECLKEMKQQLVALGCGFDWRRSFITSDPGYYRWTQWIFLQLHARELIYRNDGSALWCPQCETSLARAQVEEDRCWICASPVERRAVREWRLRLAPYLDDLLHGLGEMRDLNGLAEEGQKVLIGAHAGLRVDLALGDGGPVIAAFMPRKEDWRSACILAIHPGDEETLRRLPEERVGSAGTGGALAARMGASFPGARVSGVSANEVRTGRKIPVVVVAMTDPVFRDQPVIVPLRDFSDEDASPTDVVPEFRPLTVYSQKDFSISRQRLWGTPIPIVLCESCGEVPVPPEELPVMTAKVVLDRATGRLKREDPDWDLRACPRCGRSARLDPQVMDCHMDSIWHPFRPCASERSPFLFDPDEVRYWMPADLIQFGRDVIPFMLDLRFLSHFLHRTGHVPFREFCRDVLAHGLILHEGRKMSKHLGNVVKPDEVIHRYGADSLRFYVLARAEPRSDLRWSEDGAQRYFAMLSAYHAMLARHGASRPGRAGGTGGDSGDAGAAPTFGAPLSRLDRAEGDRYGRYTNVFLKKAGREAAVLETSVDQGRYDRYAGALARLLAAMDFFHANHLAKEANPSFAALWRAWLERSVLYLAPVAPHLAEECWELLGHEGSIFAAARFAEQGVGAPAKPQSASGGGAR